MRLKLAASMLTAAILASTAGAEVGDRWPLVAFDEAADCKLAITSSGRALQIRAGGLIPGETLNLTITNGDMKPIALSLRAGADGNLQRYYLPFRFNHDGGLVEVRIEAARCTLSAATPWTRGVPTIP